MHPFRRHVARVLQCPTEQTHYRLFSKNLAILNQESQQQQQQQSQQQPPKEDNKTTELQKKLEELEVKAKEYETKYKSALAEMENVRRIARLDVDKAKDFGISSFAKSLLDVSDNLHRALNLINSEEIKKVQDEKLMKKISSFHQGINMTKTILLKVLENNGIAKMPDPTGKPFDAKFHEAMLKQPDPSKPHNTVFHLINDGYLIKERVLRPAQVAVVVDDNAPDEVPATPEQEQQEKKNE